MYHKRYNIMYLEERFDLKIIKFSCGPKCPQIISVVDVNLFETMIG